jgi:hypothetical protein
MNPAGCPNLEIGQGTAQATGDFATAFWLDNVLIDYHAGGYPYQVALH